MNRRTFLRKVQPILHGAAQPANTSHTEAPCALFAEPPSLEPYAGPWDRAAVLHLLRRTVGAPTYAELQEAQAMTMEALVTRLTTDASPLPGPPRYVGLWMDSPLIAMDSSQVYIFNGFFDELRRWWYAQMINGGLSMRERMTFFWHNHFPTIWKLVHDARLLYVQNQLFRRHALGNFKDLVRQVTIDKAMLIYLNGKNNKAQWVNENYARELQELFTIGIADNSGAANYTQADVVQAARALTGWDWNGYGIAFDVAGNWLSGHDSSNKTVYGRSIAGNTEALPELNALLDIIFEREETARYVIRKLYRFLLYTDVTLTPVQPIAPEVEENIIKPLAAEFRAGGWDIAVVLRRLLQSRHFYDRGLMGAMIKSPADLFVSTIRATATAKVGAGDSEFAMEYAQQKAEKLGLSFFDPPGVQGWQFYRSSISTSTLPARRRNTDELIEGLTIRIDEVRGAILGVLDTAPQQRTGSWKMNVMAYAKQFATFNDPELLVRDIAEHLLAYPADAALLAALKAELVGPADYEWSDAPAAIQESRLRAMLRRLMRSSNYQLT